MLVGADDGAIDDMEVPIELTSGLSPLLQRVKQRLEDTGLLPAGEAAGYRPPRAIARRPVVPGGASAQNPEQAIEDAAMVGGRSARPWFWRWEQRSEPLPLSVGEVSSVHST